MLTAICSWGVLLLGCGLVMTTMTACGSSDEDEAVGNGIDDLAYLQKRIANDGALVYGVKLGTDAEDVISRPVANIEEALDTVWGDLSAQAQAVIDQQGVAYNDRDGDLVTSIVGGKDCVFTCYDGDNCLCALERAFRNGKTRFCKPISCALYPIREKRFHDGTVALNYNRWKVCEDAVKKGQALGLPVYRFLKEPLTRRFGSEWYDELCAVADQLLTSPVL